LFKRKTINFAKIAIPNDFFYICGIIKEIQFNMKINRLAVSVFFFTNGFQYANWVARLPEVQTLYGVSNTTLGTILLCSAAGAMTAMPFAGLLTVRIGSRLVTIATAIAFVLAIPFMEVCFFFLVLWAARKMWR
jgi:MFS family permease